MPNLTLKANNEKREKEYSLFSFHFFNLKISGKIGQNLQPTCNRPATS